MRGLAGCTRQASSPDILLLCSIVLMNSMTFSVPVHLSEKVDMGSTIGKLIWGVVIWQSGGEEWV